MFELYNKTTNAVLPEDVELKDLDFMPLKSFIGESFVLGGYYFHTGKFGRQVTLYAKTGAYPKGVKINIPKRYTATFEKIHQDEEAKKAILSGKVMIVGIKEYSSKNGVTVGFEFKDC